MIGWFRKKKKKEQEPVVEEQQELIGEQTVEEEQELVEEVQELSPSTVENEEKAVVESVRTETQEVEVDEPEPEQNIVADTEDSSSVPPPADEKKSLFSRLQSGLSKTRQSFVYRLDTLFLGKKEIDQELFDDLEEILITADLGVNTVLELLDEVRKEVKRAALKDPQSLKEVLSSKIRGYLQEIDTSNKLAMPEKGPLVIMVIGVNGVGKTTSIGKLAAKFVRSGKSVLLVAGDTFRAAAIDQLKIWGDRNDIEVVSQKPGSDPSSVVFDAMELGIARDYDVVLIDTAGRLHTQVNLMEELKKIKRVIGKKLEGAPHEVMLVLDATTGQNGISQAKMFNEAVGITGVTLTKLDGTAKGGIVINISRELKIPVRFIGVGEQIDDLRDFNSKEFVDALFYKNPDETTASE